MVRATFLPATYLPRVSESDLRGIDAPVQQAVLEHRARREHERRHDQRVRVDEKHVLQCGKMASAVLEQAADERQAVEVARAAPPMRDDGGAERIQCGGVGSVQRSKCNDGEWRLLWLAMGLVREGQCQHSSRVLGSARSRHEARAINGRRGRGGAMLRGS